VIEPARKLAADGFVVNEALVKSIKGSEKLLERFPESKRIFLNGGKYYQPGDIFKQPQLADTLARIQKNGARGFYKGKTAQLIADDMSKNGGLIALDDLKNYKAVEREPVKGTYRGYELLTMPPPSSGGLVLVEMLNMLEQFDLKAMGPYSAEKYQLMIEVMKRAFADRSEFLGDPDFVKVPGKGLISKKYAAGLAKTIDLSKATPSMQIKPGNPAPYETNETTHFTVVDAAGNAVSNTYTINSWYGGGATVPGAGFLLNNEMDDFASKVGVPNQFGLIQGEANAVAPRKRPLSSMTPTIVLKDGKVAFALGSPGGPRIINSVLQVIVNVIDHDMTLDKAVAAPRIHHQWLPDVIRYEPNGLSKEVMDVLAAKGYKFADSPGLLGDVEAVGIDLKTGVRIGVPDPRNSDAKAVGN
jgi:gamma-glutamyltranspeptidase/glutathione hydrolase